MCNLTSYQIFTVCVRRKPADLCSNLDTPLLFGGSRFDFKFEFFAFFFGQYISVKLS